MTHRQTAWLGGGLVVLALGLAILKPSAGGPEAGAAGPPTEAKFRERGVLGGTVAQRLERFKGLWRAVSGGTASKEDAKLAAELIASLPAATLRDLLVELVPAAGAEGDASWLPLIARRVGELEGQRAADWLLGLRESMPENEAAPFKELFPETLRGWAAGDPLGLMAAYFDPDKASRYEISERMNEDQGAGGMGAVIIASAAARNPEEAWRAMGKWHRGMLAVAFFEGVDPAQARHYAGRLTELFADLEKPGFEHMGGEQEDWEEQQKALGAAACALFTTQPEQAIAWREEQDLASSGTRSEADRGRLAGQLSARLYREEPERALAWIGGQAEEFRQAAAAELGYVIMAKDVDLKEEDFTRLATLKEWIGGQEERIAWLQGLRRRFESPADCLIAVALLDHMDLSPAEREYITEEFTSR